jgi:hypothetical protein
MTYYLHFSHHPAPSCGQMHWPQCPWLLAPGYRSGGAMAMYLASVPIFTITLIGHWSSNVFLWYIHCQVLQFINGVSSRMVSPQAQNFFTLPDFAAEHPCTWSHRTNFQSPQHTGPRQKLSPRPCVALSPSFLDSTWQHNKPSLHLKLETLAHVQPGQDTKKSK